MRKIITSLQMSIDGFIEGPNGELDWMMKEDEEVWRDMNEMLSSVDTFILGGMEDDTDRSGRGRNTKNEATAG
jgi:RibD C-terminal domain